MEDGAALHNDWRARMVGEDEGGSVIRRVVAPPPLPSVVGPGSTNRPEHVSAQNPGAHIGESACCKVVIDARRAAVTPVYLLKRSRGEEPLMHRHAADTEGVSQVLIRAGAVAIERKGKALNLQLSHECLCVWVNFGPDMRLVWPGRCPRHDPDYPIGGVIEPFGAVIKRGGRSGLGAP